MDRYWAALRAGRKKLRILSLLAVLSTSHVGPRIASVLAAADGGTERSHSNWQDPTPLTRAFRNDAALHEITFAGPSTGWAVGDRGVIWHTDDGGATRLPDPDPFPALSRATLPISNSDRSANPRPALRVVRPNQAEGVRP